MFESIIGSLTVALFLAMIVKGVTDYLVLPLKNTPRIANWLVCIGLADKEDVLDTGISIWCIPYITFVLGIITSLAFDVDIVSQYIPGANVIASRVLTSIIVGAGSNMLHALTKK